MNIQTLDKIFKPRRIALVGVSPNPRSVSGRILANLIGGGFRGVVYPVSPSTEAVMGISCFPNVASLPKTPDLGIVCAAAAQVPALVRECGESGIRGLIVVSAGFRETGPAGLALEQAMLTEARRFEGLRIIGPNCLGLISPGLPLNASFAGSMPRPGHVAFVSQSGALCTSVLDWAAEEKLGFSHFISTGNMIDVDFGDLIDYLGEDEATKSILLYIESISDARKFMTAARAFARMKPIVAYKAGRFPESAAAAASHTGALAGEDAVYDAAFQRMGLARVFNIGEIFDCADLVGRPRIPKGRRLAVLTNAGGPGVMATDALIASGGELACLSDATLAELDAALPPQWSRRNPVDVLGDAKSKLVAKAAQIVLRDPAVDALLVIVTPQAMTNPTAVAKEVCAQAAATAKPILAAWLGGAAMREGTNLLNEAGVPTYQTPEQAVKAFMTLVSYSRNLETLYETPKDIPVDFPIDRQVLRARFAGILTGTEGALSEAVSKELLASYGIPVTSPVPAASADEAVRAADAAGYPVVLKILSPDISHKTDVGGVALDLGDAAAVRSAFAAMMATVARRAPAARLDGVTVQKMVRAGDGIEMILGVKKDATFGTVVLAGMGGTAAEIYGDRAIGFPPLNERLARRMIEELRMRPLLHGYRGRPAAAVDKLVEALVRLSYLAADFPEVAALDINPLLVTADGVVALDARVLGDRQAVEDPKRPYAHLSLRPYPEEFVRRTQMRDGTPITLRPIKPEDEPLWLALLSNCSRQSIYSRFRYFFFWQSHEVASRYCYIDYDRELAIVAETGQGPDRRIIGVGRLAAEPGRETAEYAVLVQDAWQDKGLGGLVTDFCLGIAGAWGVRTVTAITTTDNPRMIAVFEKRGFRIVNNLESSLVEVSKDLL
ncbi:MAG TPA: GNAT family N-acetyltransferase [Candidatus Aminicenantes bacterium]|nr:GNAT family N-acetyltransferase [Candidatus Aminicenantes bacterium]HRY64255.1 GNAT family N-acetyltransferase [Candidatus Aminicenantes bacterium]HRZ71168.1 GNAT family N-acetyltransferase [Candidatus Aminicenantes bacterium]